MTPKFDYYSWPIAPRGGQHVGLHCGVLIVHRTTGIAVVEESERSQHKNRQIAEARLVSLLMAIED